MSERNYTVPGENEPNWYEKQLEARRAAGWLFLCERDPLPTECPKCGSTPSHRRRKNMIELEATNKSDETGRHRMLILNQCEHDDPEQAPTYRQQRLVNLCGVLVGDSRDGS